MIGLADSAVPELRRNDAGVRARAWRPAKIWRLRDLPPRQRLALWAAFAGLALLPLVCAVIVLRQGWRPMGDNALIGLRVHDVLSGRFPLIGQPTPGENFGSGIATSHPGPIEFYLLAPFVAVFGPIVGLALGAAAIHAAAFVTTGWLAFRRGGVALFGLASLATLAMAQSLRGNLLHDPVSSNIGSFMAFALLFACWSVAAGDLRVTPVLVIVGTFALQDHLSYLGTSTLVVAVAIAIGLWWLRRARRSTNPRWLRRTVITSGALAVLLWLPVIIDEIWGDQNIVALFRTFTGKRTAGEGLSFALDRVAWALGPLPTFTRRYQPLGYLHTPSPREFALGCGVLLAILVFGIDFARRRDSAFASLALVSVLSAVSGMYAAVKLPLGAGVQPSNLRWMWTVSAFSWVALLWMAWSVLAPFWKEVLRTPSKVLGSFLLVAMVIGTVQTTGLSTDRDGPTAARTDTLIRGVTRNLPVGTYRVVYTGGAVVVSIGPALVYDLEQRGNRILMDVGPFTRAYAKHRAYSRQRVDGTIMVTTDGEERPSAGTVLLARQRFRVNRADGEMNTISVLLARGGS